MGMSIAASKLICLGYGDIASRVARRAAAAGWSVTGFCRHPSRKAAVPGVELVAGDFGNEQDLREVLAQADADTCVLVTLTPASGSGSGSASGSGSVSSSGSRNDNVNE